MQLTLALLLFACNAITFLCCDFTDVTVAISKVRFECSD